MSERIDLAGTNVRLRSTVAEDGPALVTIRMTDEVRRRWSGDDLEKEFAESLDDDTVFHLTIEAEDRIIGLVQFAEATDAEYRHASLDIYIDPAVHRRGHATDALRTLSNHLFDDRGHHRLTIDPAADNHPAIGCYAGVGFRPIGVMRSYERRADDTWADGLLMEMLAGDRAPKNQPPADNRPEELELRLLKPEARRDRRLLERLTHEDFIEIGASGRRWTRAEMIADLTASPDPGPLEVAEVRTLAINDDAALVTYRTRSSGRTVFRSSLWLKDAHGWSIRYHQATVAESTPAHER